MVIDACRICDNRTLLPVLDLGPSALTGVFPATPEQQVPTVPLELVLCSPDGCGLLQLRHTADLGLMYGEHYGYRSGIRPFMIEHLRGKVAAITERVAPGPGDLVLDIGSNDGTLLGCYPRNGVTLAGIDPSGRSSAPPTRRTRNSSPTSSPARSSPSGSAPGAPRRSPPSRCSTTSRARSTSCGTSPPSSTTTAYG